MRAYRLSVNLKLGLVLFAVAIAVASLVYTNRVVDQLREREAFMIDLWARALEELPRAQELSYNPHAETLAELEALLAQNTLDTADAQRFRDAVVWARGMPPPGEVGFITEQIVRPNLFEVPAILTDASGTPIQSRNVRVDSLHAASTARDSARVLARLSRIRDEMEATHPPIPIELSVPGTDFRLQQRLYYGESGLVRELRLFPYIQLLFVGLFVLVGYLGFSYVRRSEQSSLWVGMAKEAAHQLGTPISSLMGWTELLKMEELAPETHHEAIVEIEKDIARLRRVTSRFSDIGSLPKLEVQPLAPVIENVAQYIRRRIPQEGRRVTLDVQVPPHLRTPLNPELFEWVIENLLKNALDSIEAPHGRIEITASEAENMIVVDVTDTGKGIERRNFKNVFRPGYSSKKRGWGLGLSLARRIVEDYHGGRLRLHSSRTGPESGTTFRIELKSVK